VDELAGANLDARQVRVQHLQLAAADDDDLAVAV
jgi:hypothetical protein